MAKEALTKLIKSEFFVVVLAIGVMGLVGKVGVPEEHVGLFFQCVSGIASIYIGGRSYAKGKAA